MNLKFVAPLELLITLDSKEVKELKSCIAFRENPAGMEIRRIKNRRISSDSMFLQIIAFFAFSALMILSIYFGVSISEEFGGWSRLGIMIFSILLVGGLTLLIFMGIFLWKYTRILRKWAVVNFTPENVQFLQNDGQIRNEFSLTEIEKVYLFRYQITRQTKYITYILGYTLNIKIVLHDGRSIYSADILSSKESAPLYQIMKHIQNVLEDRNNFDVKQYLKMERKIADPRFRKLKFK